MENRRTMCGTNCMPLNRLFDRFRVFVICYKCVSYDALSSYENYAFFGKSYLIILKFNVYFGYDQKVRIKHI